MQAHTVERVESWGSRPFSGGFRELHELADRGFSGAVVVDDTWLFMLNGRVIGVFEGDIAAFGDADGTVYEAPDPSVALLFSMQERGGETQAKYYTNDTPLSEADRTLSDANFTGYIELSENVLSGDYYVVYYGGRSMSAAFVGTTEELITGDEAFERADDEVGVYEVLKTPVNVTSIPEVEDEEDDTKDADAAGVGGAGADVAGAGAGAGAGGTDDASDDGGGAGGGTGDTGDGGSAAGAGAADAAGDDADSGAGTGGDPGHTRGADRTGSTDPTPRDQAGEPAGESTRADASAPATPEADDGQDNAATSDSDATAASKPTDSATSDAPDSSPPKSSGSKSSTDGTDAGKPGVDASGDEGRRAATTEETDRVFDEEEQWQNATSVPTLDPEKSESTDGGATDAEPATSNARKRAKSPNSAAKSSNSTAKSGQGGSRSDDGGKPRTTVEKLKHAVKQRDTKLDEAAERIQNLESERDDLQDRVQSLRDERDELRKRADELQTELDAVERSDDSDSSAQPAGTDLTPDEAMSCTNLFVRYGSKGKPTLDGLDGNTDPAVVNKNLRIDHHTQFDASDATVNGEDFDSFLENMAAHRFVSWAVRELPYEIRDAGHTDGLSALYDAIPDVDRAELDGTVEVDTDAGTTTRTFDVVLRDRMGEPLVVAELNAEREPVTGVEMDNLVDAATAIREGVDELSAAMYVTASFFEPAALETASEETGGGGFLSRSDRKSFVNVGRKAGYHLCLVEDRNDAFHLTVPEL